jgi:hypothetical protein
MLAPKSAPFPKLPIATPQYECGEVVNLYGFSEGVVN